ncbi:tetratricopeptide repeat protein, partial [bacterium]|nr:tetratricopeptide repeat protein [bacterium]
EGYYYLALVRFNEEDFEEAVECMKRAITYDVTNPLYYAEMSKIYKAKDDIKTALEYISEAESIDNSTEYKLMYKELAALNRKK